MDLDERRRRWISAAVAEVAEHPAEATQGTRNASLFRAAARLAELPDEGEAPDDAQIKALLTDAANRAGLPGREAVRTIGSGIRRGRRNRKGWPAHLAGGPRHRSAPAPSPAPAPDPLAELWRAARRLPHGALADLSEALAEKAAALEAEGMDREQAAALAPDLVRLPGGEGEDLVRLLVSLPAGAEPRPDRGPWVLARGWSPIGRPCALLAWYPRPAGLLPAPHWGSLPALLTDAAGLRVLRGGSPGRAVLLTRGLLPWLALHRRAANDGADVGTVAALPGDEAALAAAPWPASLPLLTDPEEGSALATALPGRPLLALGGVR